MLDFIEDLGHGIYCIDTGFHRPRFDAAYLIVEAGRAAFVDCGTNFAVPRLLAALTDLGLSPDAVDWLILTHVHLDHAGGAGLLMQSLPKARLVVHARGARHMINPTVLYQGALGVYGQAEMDRSYGQLLPIEAGRVVPTQDHTHITLATRQLRFADTPGHAAHHHCVWDAQSQGWFTGDTFGLSYREFDSQQGAFVFPTSTPVQFDPVALKGSIRRMLSASPSCMYPTHYGRIGASVAEVQRLAAQLEHILDAMVAIATRHQHHHERGALIRHDLAALLRDAASAHGSTLSNAEVDELLALDVALNTQGLEIWLDKSARPANSA